MARYVPDHKATGRYLRGSPDLQRVTLRVADNIADYARAIAPRGPAKPPRRGRSHQHYADHIDVAPHRGWDRRVGARVHATAPHSAAVEWGNAHRKPQRVLTRAASALKYF